MTQADWIYAAGFFDGEGCVIIHLRKAILPRGVTRQYMVRVHVTNTNAEVIRWFKDTFGGNISTQPPRPRRRRAWKWNAASRMCEAFLIGVRPHLKIKAAEADCALELQARISATKKRPHPGFWGQPSIEPEELDRREALRVRLLELRDPHYEVCN